MKKGFSSILLILTLATCTPNKTSDSDKPKIGEVKGDFLKFVGPNSDSTGFLELFLDNDNKFVVRTRLAVLDTTIETDSGEVHEFAFDNGIHNICVGRWTDIGDGLRLDLVDCTSEMFDTTRNAESIKVIDKQTVLLDKDVKQLWIWRTLCNKE